MTSDFFSCLENAVNFFILRHGESEGNAGKIMQGRKEYSLSEAGRFQAASRGRALQAALGSGKSLLFSSPMGRALETAQIIATQIISAKISADQLTAGKTAAQGASFPEPVCLDDLTEMSLGIWTGKTWEEVKNDEPALWSAFMARSWDAIPGAESSADLYKRSLRLWAVLRDAAIEYRAENVITVTHGGLIQWILKSTLQCRAWFPLFPISNCGLFKLRVQPRPEEKSAYMCWEEINSPIPDFDSDIFGFSSKKQ